MGPVDYLVVEWTGRQPNGEAAPHLIDLVDRGLIRILDLAFIAKAEDGSVVRLEIADLGDEVAAFAEFEGASSGLLSDEDTSEAADALEPGTSAALLVYENTLGGAVRLRGAPFRGRARRLRPDPSPRPDRRSRRGRVRGLRRKEAMPGLLRGVARTAVIAGTATSVSNRVSRRQGQRWAQQEEQQQPARAGSRGSRRAAAGGESVIDQLKELGELKAQGILTEEEFAAQKAKLLG